MDVNTGVATESNVMVASETDTAVGMETGVNAEVGTDSKSAVDTSGNVSIGASAEVEARVGMSATVAGAGADMADVAEAMIYAGMGKVPSAYAVVSEHSALAGGQHGTIMVETDVVVGADIHTVTGPEIIGAPGVEVEAVVVGCAETGSVAAGASAKTATLAGLVVGWTEGKTGPCAAFNVGVAEQDTNTMWGVSSNSGGGTRVHLTSQAGVGV